MGSDGESTIAVCVQISKLEQLVRAMFCAPGRNRTCDLHIRLSAVRVTSELPGTLHYRMSRQDMPLLPGRIDLAGQPGIFSRLGGCFSAWLLFRSLAATRIPSAS